MSCPACRRHSTKRAAVSATPFTSGGYVSVTTAMRSARFAARSSSYSTASFCMERDAASRSRHWRDGVVAVLSSPRCKTVAIGPYPRPRRQTRRTHKMKALLRDTYEELKSQRWDDHRYYHHSRINQSLHFVSAASFLTAYALVFFQPVIATLIGWLLAMTARQSGHFFFEPKGYDHVN